MSHPPRRADARGRGGSLRLASERLSRDDGALRYPSSRASARWGGWQCDRSIDRSRNDRRSMRSIELWRSGGPGGGFVCVPRGEGGFYDREPGGATVAFFSPLASKARLTVPSAFACSMNSLT